MNIQMIGVDHERADIDVRALFAFTKAHAREAMIDLCSDPSIHGCIILSTCNRMEVWIHGEEGARIPLIDKVCRIKNLPADSYRHIFVERTEEDAIRHLFSMTSGLKSLILGEDQILTQVKTALSESHEVQCTDSVLETLFRMAITGAKKVKTGMQRSMTNVSAIEQAVRLLKGQRNIDLSGAKCLVIGNGEMGKRAALAFKGEGANVTVTVRQYRSGMVEIPEGCDRINYGDRYQLIPECNYVISATSSPNMTLTAADLKPIRGNKTQTYIDLAVPRDIDPAIGTWDNTELFTIDDFAVTQSAENQEILEHAAEVLEEQVQEYINWFQGRNLIPRVRKIGELSARDAWWRMGRTVKKLSLDGQEQELLQQAMVSSTDKVIEKLLFTIRNEAGMDVFRSCLDALKEWEDR